MKRVLKWSGIVLGSMTDDELTASWFYLQSLPSELAEGD